MGEQHHAETAAPQAVPSDEHAQAHARDILKRTAGGRTTNWQIILFGLTGGLVPCPAAITVLVLCLQLHQLIWGAVIVISFSIGLALTLTVSGVVAAWGVRHAVHRWPRLDLILARAPYLTSGVIAGFGLYLGIRALLALRPRVLPQ